ncbi:hypothetical protein CL632_03600 [bacterium]|jgi:hypothetical protein|nr:hypothetical protein [bacterium]MDP6571713.1 hypothetical protein [Patescibacteria group bacterium]MDP6756064.1 hypothetical protein [Patescibacteria group bacterium]|tara:strand:+ start:10007 stop:10402 length:396 start_codon:yes stop_codon:yes gene_type:complete
MKNFKGIIIEESLADKSILDKVTILATDVEPVTEKHKTPWVKQWTKRMVEIPANQALNIAKIISKALNTTHGAWYADFKNSTHHYIIFTGKIFYIDRKNKQQYNAAKQYGITLGIPEYQVDFHPDVKYWER